MEILGLILVGLLASGLVGYAVGARVVKPTVVVDTPTIQEESKSIRFVENIPPKASLPGMLIYSGNDSMAAKAVYYNNDLTADVQVVNVGGDLYQVYLTPEKEKIFIANGQFRGRRICS